MEDLDKVELGLMGRFWATAEVEAEVEDKTWVGGRVAEVVGGGIAPEDEEIKEEVAEVAEAVGCLEEEEVDDVTEVDEGAERFRVNVCRRSSWAE